MKIFKFWVRREKVVVTTDKKLNIVVYGGSNQSAEDAESEASKVLERVEQHIYNEKHLRATDEYFYGDRPIREEIIREICDNSGTLKAVITRNRYGAQVLNTENLFIADIDFPTRFNLVTFFRNLFSKKIDPAVEILERVGEVLKLEPHVGVRVYRTAAGIRLLATNNFYSPTSAESLKLLEAFHSDPLYIRLCIKQECFRARLTPKPWRLKVPAVPHSFPCGSSDAQVAYENWVKKYEQKSQGRAVCRFEGVLGNPVVLPEINDLIELHDAYCLGDGDLV